MFPLHVQAQAPAPAQTPISSLTSFAPFAEFDYSVVNDTCVTWGTIRVPDSESYAAESVKRLTIKAPLTVMCTTPEDYPLAIWLDGGDRLYDYQIANDSINLTEASSLSDWKLVWTVPSDLGLDVNYGYTIIFTDADQAPVATSDVFFLSPDPAPPAASSASSTQSSAPAVSSTQSSVPDVSNTPSSAPVLSTSSPSTTDAASPVTSLPNTPSPSPGDNTPQPGLSKGAAAGIAIGVAAVAALLGIGGTKLYLNLKHKRQAGRAQEAVVNKRTSDGREIRHLGVVDPDAIELDRVGPQPRDKAATVLGM